MSNYSITGNFHSRLYFHDMNDSGIRNHCKFVHLLFELIAYIFKSPSKSIKATMNDTSHTVVYLNRASLMKWNDKNPTLMVRFESINNYVNLPEVFYFSVPTDDEFFDSSTFAPLLGDNHPSADPDGI